MYCFVSYFSRYLASQCKCEGPVSVVCDGVMTCMLAEKTRLASLCNRETRERKWADSKLTAFLHFFTRDESTKAKKKKTQNGQKTSQMKNLLYSFSASKRGEMNKKGVYNLSKDCGVSAAELAKLRQLVLEVRHVPAENISLFF